MTTLEADTLNNLSIVDIIYVYFNRLLGIFGLTSHVSCINSWNDNFSVKVLAVKYDDLATWLAFDEFQVNLLKVFLSTLIVCLVLILLMWKIYGKRICLRFMKPAATKAIDELRNSVAQLKLPKEHSPRL